jgi:hypothetical protein
MLVNAQADAQVDLYDARPTSKSRGKWGVKPEEVSTGHQLQIRKVICGWGCGMALKTDLLRKR